MKIINVKTIIFAVLSLISINANALILTPSDCGLDNCFTSNDPSEPSVSDIQDYIGTSTVLSNLYKSEVDGTVDFDAYTSTGLNEGTYSGSYTTIFSNWGIDPADALISYNLGTDVLSCVECYLSIKGGSGNNGSSLYIFDISSWDGTEEIELTGFLPGSGAISNVAIWGGGEVDVPEPGTLALFGLGLLGMALGRRKLK